MRYHSDYNVRSTQRYRVREAKRSVRKVFRYVFNSRRIPPELHRTIREMAIQSIGCKGGVATVRRRAKIAAVAHIIRHGQPPREAGARRRLLTQFRQVKRAFGPTAKIIESALTRAA